MSRTIIIPDVHHRRQIVDSILQSETYDKVVFLGDFFDNWDDGPMEAGQTAVWLKEKLQDPKFVFLWGNHDCPYAFSKNHHLGCSGFTLKKSKVVAEVLKPQDWSKFKLCHVEQGFLLSHAGAHPWVFAHSGKLLTIEEIESTCAQTLEVMHKNTENYILGCGVARYGSQPLGGILWLDWNQEFEPIPGINQIVGHTIVMGPSTKITKDSTNYNLDTNSKHYAVIEDGFISIKETPKN